jgi:predicted secreted Zn-dependent protease
MRASRSRRSARSTLVVGLALVLVGCGDQSVPTAAPASIAASPASSASPAGTGAAPTSPAASPSPAGELLPIGGTWRVRKILSPKDRGGLVADRTFDEETYIVAPSCGAEPCPTIDVTTTPLGLTSPAHTTRLTRSGATYASKASVAESTDCTTVEGSRVAGGATATTNLTIWVATERPAGTSVASTVLRGEIELDVKPTSIGESAGCEAQSAAFDLTGRRETVAVRDPNAEPTGPDLKPPTGARYVTLPRLDASVSGATVHYFAISGDTSPELILSVARGGGKACGAIDYEWYRGDSRPSACTLTYLTDMSHAIQTRLSGSTCKVVRARVRATYAIYMPRWTAPARVPSRLLDWWRRIVDFIATHEAGHVRIGQAWIGKLNSRLSGIDCDQVDPVIQAWAKQAAAAQEAYDRSEYSKPWPRPATGY